MSAQKARKSSNKQKKVKILTSIFTEAYTFAFPDSQMNSYVHILSDQTANHNIHTEQFYTSLDVLLTVIKLQGIYKLSTLKLKNTVGKLQHIALYFQWRTIITKNYSCLDSWQLYIHVLLPP